MLYISETSKETNLISWNISCFPKLYKVKAWIKKIYIAMEMHQKSFAKGRRLL